MTDTLTRLAATIAARKGADPDTMVASARAYVSALNKLMAKRGRTRPAAMNAGV